MSKLNEGSFISTVRINCCRPLDGGRKIVIGTDLGVYVFDRRPKDIFEKPKRVLDCRLVTQIEVLEQHHLIIILTHKVVTSYSLDALNTEESPGAPSKRGRHICNANYINAGTCNGQSLVCCVKSKTWGEKYILAFEPEFIEMRQSDTGGLVCILMLKHSRLLHLSSREVSTES